MRIYKSDGTFTENPGDNAFGWNFCDIVIDEAVPDHQIQNEEIRRGLNTLPKIIQIHPRIKIQEAESVIEPEDTVKEKSSMKNLESIDSKIVPKAQVADLINPCSIESKALLSIVHFAKYKKLHKDVVNLGDIRSTSRIKCLISQKSEDLVGNLRAEINNYNEAKEENMFSIMMELVLSDTKCDISEITCCNTTDSNLKSNNGDSSDLGIGNSLSGESSGDYQNNTIGLLTPSRMESMQPRSELLSSMGFSDIVDRSIERICEETYDIHVKIAEIRKSFQEEERRVNSLIDEAQLLQQQLRGATFLDQVLHLLNGNVHKSKMAKKGQVIQLQTEVNNDEEWEKLLERDGLILVDVYSEWCGPCSGMAANLKKIKLEIGGDLLQLAVAKSDKITALERFRGKSEPTWMFIVNGKLVNFMFGASAPKLTRMIIDELKKENEAREGRRERVEWEITDLTEEEKERLEIILNKERASMEKELVKMAKELFERRTAEANHILEHLDHFGFALIFPHAKARYKEVILDLLGEAGLTISQTEKVIVTESELQQLFYFLEEDEMPIPEEAMEELLTEESMALLIKPIPARDITEPTQDLIREVLYGDSKEPPGGKDSPAHILSELPPPPEAEHAEDSQPDVHHHPQPHVTEHRMGVWCPLDDMTRATSLRLFFPKISQNYWIAEPEPTPPHFVVIFDAYRRSEVQQLMNKFPEQIIRYGFFTEEKPEKAKLVAKSIYKYEKSPDRAPDQRMVIQLSKKKSEAVLAFAQLKPNYISPNTKEGERECKIFFPDEYDEPPGEDEEEAAAEEEKALEKAKKAVSETDSAKEDAGGEEVQEGEQTETEATDTEAQQGEETTDVPTTEDAATTEEPTTTDVGETTDEESPA